MNRDEKFVITINRELGSGGGSVGRRLAERLDVKFYNKAVIRALKEKYHLSTEEIEKLKGQKEGWWAEFQRRVVPFSDEKNDGPEIITTEDVFKSETEIVKNLAESGSCVIVGRSAFHVLRDHQELSREVAIKTIKQVDERRENYVNRFANTSRYDTRNYDLVISMERLKIDDAVDIILGYIFRQAQW